MNLNSREIHRLNIIIKSLFNRRCLGLLVLPLLCCLGGDCLPALSTICFFNCLACVWAFVCFALVCLNIFLSFIQVVIICAGDIRLLFKLSFGMYQNTTVGRSSLPCNSVSKKTSPQHWRFSVALKRNEMT